MQEQEQDFDRSLIFSLEEDVVPRLGEARVPDDLIAHLGKTLQIASRLHDLDLKRANEPLHYGHKPEPKGHGRSSGFATQSSSSADTLVGTTTTGRQLPRENFTYWCFELLFLVCSDAFTGRRV